jgi:hypothetical protein
MGKISGDKIMDNKKLIAEALLDLAKNSLTTIIEVSDDKELIAAAKIIGIVVPSPDLAVLKTVYAEIDKANRNGVVLPKNAVEKGLPTLIGKQINWEHEGAGRICGYIIDAKINENKIEIIGVVFKSLFPDEMVGVKEKFADKELAVSFEIWNRNPEDGESVVHELANGFRSIDPIIFHGCGLLLANQPACPKAIVYKLIASKEIEAAEKIVDKIFEENLICASMAIEEPKCKNCTSCTCEKEGQKVEEIKLEEILVNDYEGGEIEEAAKLTTEQRNALPDSDFALIQERDGKKVRRFPINDEAHVRNALARLPQAKDITEEERTSALAKILKKAKALNMTELLKKYEKSSEETQTEVKTEETKPVDAGVETKPVETKVEETKEEIKTEAVFSPIDKKVVCVVNEETTTITDTMDGKVERKGMRKTTRKFDDGTEEVFAEEFQAVSTYTQAQVDEQVNTAKSEKDAEITALKVEHDKTLQAKDEELKNKNTELEQKTQEIAKLTVVEEPKTEKIMTVGAVETEKISEIKRQAKKINDIIASKHS